MLNKLHHFAIARKNRVPRSSAIVPVAATAATL